MIKRIPKRIQLSRKKGHRKPPDAVNVARPTKWGNPFNWKDSDTELIPEATAKHYAKESFNQWLRFGEVMGVRHPKYDEQRQWILDHIHELQGKDLACWCKPGEPCHAEVLRCLANQGDVVFIRKAYRKR